MSSSKNVHSITLEIGCQTTDTIQLFRFLDKEPVFHLMSENRYVPYLDYHTSCILFTAENTDDIVFSYELVPCDPKIKTDTLYLRETSNTVRYNHKDIKENCNKIHFNHPVLKLYAFFPECVETVETVELKINNNNNTGPILVFSKEHNYFVLDFSKYGIEKTLNFSNIDLTTIEITTNDTTQEITGHIFAISKLVMRYSLGMAGMAFSK